MQLLLHLQLPLILTGRMQQQQGVPADLLDS
jgi:hypothetical protein